MSEPKFTPGPWTVSEISACEVINSDGRRIADCFGLSLSSTEEVDRANANFIAAGPCLYSFVRKRAEQGDADAVNLLITKSLL